MKFSEQIKKLQQEQLEILKSEIYKFLNRSFKSFFEKHKNVISIKINVGFLSKTEYTVYNDSETLKINGYSLIDIEDESWDNDDEYISNTNLTQEQYLDACEDAEKITTEIPNDIFLLVFGNAYGLKIEPHCISLEISDLYNEESEK